MESVTPDPLETVADSQLPESWTTPVSDSVQTEAHAATVPRSSNGMPHWSFPPGPAALTRDPSVAVRPLGTPPPSEPADAAGNDVGESLRRIGSDEPELIEHDYQPLLARLEAECRRVISSAETEAETVRSKAEDEARRIVTDAHRERSALLRAATSKQAMLYEEAESEIQRWLEELEQERQAVLDLAHDEAESQAAQRGERSGDARPGQSCSRPRREAARIVADARAEATRRLGGERSRPAPSAPTPESASGATPVEWRPESPAPEASPGRPSGAPTPAESESRGQTPEDDLSPASSSEPTSTAGASSSSEPAEDGAATAESDAWGATLTTTPAAVDEAGDWLSDERFAALLRGGENGAAASSGPGAPTESTEAELVPPETEVLREASEPIEAGAAEEPSASRRERRRRRRFGRTQP